jgi:hypothetical protein
MVCSEFPTQFRLSLGQKTLEFVSNHSAKKTNARNSIPWNKNRSKLSKFRSEPCCGREKKLEIPFRGIKKEETFGMLFQSISRKKRRSLFAGTANFRFKSVSQTRHPKMSEKTTFEVRTNHFVKLFLDEI